MRGTAGVCLMVGMTAIAGCGEVEPDVALTTPDYRWAETLRMADDLVNVRVGVADAGAAAQVTDYADCVAAEYALRQGFSFARHVRTTLSVEGGLWQGDAVYTISPTLPAGLRTIDAETRVAACLESGIPVT